MSGRCPRCSAPIASPADDRGVLVCRQCGARLKAVAPTPRATTVSAVPVVPAAPAAAARASNAASAESDAMLAELRSFVRGQAEVLHTLQAILATLQAGASPTPFSDLGWGSDARHVRTRQRRKSVLVVDDDDAARRATEAAFSAAQVPVRAVADGNSAIAAIAEDKPDVVILELGLAEPMGGKDVINMIKATMEWVDLPIVLHTRVPIESHKEARTIHGADDFVSKGEGSLDALVARVIQTFQKDQAI